jgi:hypothetical protein
MGVRRVRLDDEAEKALEQIMRLARLSISRIFRGGLTLLRADLLQQAQRRPYDIYAELDLGPGRYATAPLTPTLLPRIASAVTLGRYTGWAVLRASRLPYNCHLDEMEGVGGRPFAGVKHFNGHNPPVLGIIQNDPINLKRFFDLHA